MSAIKIVNADDFGISSSVNHAIVKCFEKDIINQTTLMINMPYAGEAVKLAKMHDFMDRVGLHLNLTKGEPLTEDIKSVAIFCDKNGNFNGVHQTKILFRLFIFNPKIRTYCKEEIFAQMQKYKEYGLPLMHIDSHHHIHTNFSLLGIIIRLAKKNSFKSMRISRNMMADSESKLKKIYKNFINKKIIRNFSTLEYFGSNDDYQNYYKGRGHVEIMVHPEIINNELVDVISKDHYDSMCKID